MKLEEFDSHRRTVHTDAGELGYADVGQGRTALFVHGLGTNGYLWRNVIDLVKDEHRCVALDLPLHGHSRSVRADLDLSLSSLADVIEQFCAALGLTDVDLVANDTGAAISQIFASRHPERLATFTLTNCEADDNIPNEAFRNTVEVAKRGELAPYAVQMFENLEMARSGERPITANYQYPDEVTDETLRSYLGPVCATLEDARRFERLLSSLDPADLRGAVPGLRRLTVPTLIVWGTGDFHFELEWAHWLRDTIPGATEVVEIEGGKLYFPDERAADLVPHLRRHWSAQPPRPVEVPAG
jgi:pimeloyl-ACP methyl ester carboxylesterase